MAMTYLTIIISLCLFHGFMMVFRNTLQGMGHGLSALFSGGVEVAGRVTASIMAVSRNSFTMIALANPMAWCLSMLYCMVSDITYLRKRKIPPRRP